MSSRTDLYRPEIEAFVRDFLQSIGAEMVESESGIFDIMIPERHAERFEDNTRRRRGLARVEQFYKNERDELERSRRGEESKEREKERLDVMRNPRGNALLPMRPAVYSLSKTKFGQAF